MHSEQVCDSCVLIRVSTILICQRAIDKSKDVQVEIWSTGQAMHTHLTPVHKQECRADRNVYTRLGVICYGIEREDSSIGHTKSWEVEEANSVESIEAHLEMKQKRGHTSEAVVEDEDEETTTPKHTEGMRPKITEETIWWIN